MDETLCDTRKADLLAAKEFSNHLLEHFKINKAELLSDQFLKAIYKTPEALKSLKSSKIEEKDYRSDVFKWVCKQNDIAIELPYLKLSEHMMSLRMKYFDFFDGAWDLLQKLRKDYQTVLITNGVLYSQQPKLNACNMQASIDHIILAGETPYEKPQREIFNLACRKASVAPDQAIHIGDRLDADIQGAINSGIDSIWINPDQLEGSLHLNPTYTVKRFIDIENIFY